MQADERRVPPSDSEIRSGARVPARKSSTPAIGTTFSFGVDQPSRVTFSFRRTATNNLRFEGPITRRAALAPGSYRVTITATNPSGKASSTHTLRFTIATK